MSESITAILADVFSKSPFVGKVFLVGGFLRDRQLGIDAKDIDVFVASGRNSGVEAAVFFSKALGVYNEQTNPVTYPRFGTAMVHLKDGLVIEFVGSEPGDHSVDELLKIDALRRDFTVNTLAQNVSESEVLDPTGQGLTDILHQRLRTPVDPMITLTDDPLRALRAIRFSLSQGFRMDLSLLRSMRETSSEIAEVSPERVRSELEQILVCEKPSRGIRILLFTGLLDHILPEVANLDGVTQNRYHDRDVLGHSLAALDATPAELIPRLGALLHDIGKPSTRSEVNAKVQFLGHPEAGALITRTLMKRLTFPTADISRVESTVRWHMDLKDSGPDGSQTTDGRLRRFIHRVGTNLSDTLTVMHADNLSHAPEACMPLQVPAIRERIAEWDLDRYMNPQLPIDGHDVVSLGVTGKSISEILDRITRHYLQRDGLTREQALEIAADMAE